MQRLQQQLVTDQNISQMISSYLLRNRELLYTLRESVACEPIPVHRKKTSTPASSASIR